MTMDPGVSVVGADERRSEPGNLDTEQLARSIRRLAIAAHAILRRPDAPRGELVDLRRQLKELLREARGGQLAEIERWLRSAVRMLDARLLCGLGVELGLTVNGNVPSTGGTIMRSGA
jgi:hypothetical protein